MVMYVCSASYALVNSTLSIILSFQVIRIKMDLLIYFGTVSEAFHCPEYIYMTYDEVSRFFGKIRAMIFQFEKSLRLSESTFPL